MIVVLCWTNNMVAALFIITSLEALLFCSRLSISKHVTVMTMEKYLSYGCCDDPCSVVLLEESLLSLSMLRLCRTV